VLFHYDRAPTFPSACQQVSWSALAGVQALTCCWRDRSHPRAGCGNGGARFEMKLATKRGDVDLNRALAELEIAGNLFVRHASGETLQHVALARR
jgi:hypothetical protein